MKSDSNEKIFCRNVNLNSIYDIQIPGSNNNNSSLDYTFKLITIHVEIMFEGCSIVHGYLLLIENCLPVYSSYCHPNSFVIIHNYNTVSVPVSIQYHLNHLQFIGTRPAHQSSC